MEQYQCAEACSQCHLLANLGPCRVCDINACVRREALWRREKWKNERVAPGIGESAAGLLHSTESSC